MQPTNISGQLGLPVSHTPTDRDSDPGYQDLYRVVFGRSSSSEDLFADSDPGKKWDEMKYSLLPSDYGSDSFPSKNEEDLVINAPFPDPSYPFAQVQEEKNLELIEKMEDLGSGSFGKVAIALVRDPNNGMRERRVALKQIVESTNSVSQKYFQEELARSRALRETMRQGKIPGVAKILGFIPVGNDVSIAMKYYNSGHLGLFLYMRFFSPQDYLRIGIAVGSGVANLHRAGYIHHDLKQNNILVHEKNGSYTFHVGDHGFVDPFHPPSKMPENFNRTHAPKKAIEAYISSSERDKIEVWNSPKYDDFMYGFLLWQLFSTQTETVPWTKEQQKLPEQNPLSKEDLQSIEKLFPSSISSELKEIIQGLLDWESSLSTEEAVERLRQLEQKSLS